MVTRWRMCVILLLRISGVRPNLQAVMRLGSGFR